MRKKNSSSSKKKKKNLPLPTANSSKNQNKSGLSIANFCTQMPSKAESNNSRLKSICKTSRRKENSSIMSKQWYFTKYTESNQKR